MYRCKIIEYLEGSLSDGGAETLIKDYCLLLDNSRFEPIILVDWVFRNSANYHRLADSNVRIVSFYPRYSIFWRAVNKFFRNQFINYRLGKILAKERPDVLHVHLAALDRVLSNRQCLGNARLFYTCHNEPRFYFDGDMSYECEAAKVLIRENGLRLIALHSDMALELNRRFSVDNTIVIRNGIRLSDFKRKALSREQKRSELAIPPSAYVAIHIGRFVPQKNHAFLLDVFASMVQKRDDCYLVLIGDGEGEFEIRERIRQLDLDDKIRILSNRTDIVELLEASDVFLFPSLFEGLGIALVEAQAKGLHSIVSDTIPKEAFVTDLVIPMSLKDSPEEWADRALDLSLKSQFPNRLEDYDMEKEIKKLESLYLDNT